MSKLPGLKIKPLPAALGAEIHGVDLAQPLVQEALATIEQAFLDYQVIFFRDQQLLPADLCRFGRYFGALGRYPFVAGMPDYPDVVEIIKEPEQTSNFGGIWHTDTSYLEQPPKATLLYACEVPPVGGDTVFTNLYRAYEQLSSGMQGLLADLIGINSAALTAKQVRGEHIHSGAMRSQAQAQAANARDYAAEHPIVQTHPETGRKTLYFSPAHTACFKTMTPAESAPLLHYLADFAVRPEFGCRFRWGKGSLALWDNRCVLHCAINDYDGHRRMLQRVTIAG